ncbi:hypothetical protein FRC12_020663 [Ceratobasidium sp. 428]|nr:hypothetical protein FRC12_020663 [Ceratobasidium sp. 428]
MTVRIMFLDLLNGMGRVTASHAGTGCETSFYAVAGAQFKFACAAGETDFEY